MRDKVFHLFADLHKNNFNKITFFRNNLRYEKTFSNFAKDIDEILGRLLAINEIRNIKTIALIGPTSYDWIICDFACIKGGFLTAAIPETLPSQIVEEILKDVKADLVLIDLRLKEQFILKESETYYIECSGKLEERDFFKIKPINIAEPETNRMLEEYSLVFSSGTSEKLKKIKKTFSKRVPKNNRKFRLFEYIKYKRSFWSRKDNKLIIFMPFSHPQQRDFFLRALFGKINIVLSDPYNCLKHIILEKPNIMISVPVIYEAMAQRIKIKLERFSLLKKVLFRIFNVFRINLLSNRNILKKLFSSILFKEIRKIYGNRADYFITGSAAISEEIIKIFLSIGVRLLQGYGQSELGNIALSTSENFKVGSVGKPLLDIKINVDSEILVKYDEKRHANNKDILDIKEGYIHTSDLGYIDKDGYLFILGRKDDVIVIENGKKIHPEKIEKILKETGSLNDVFIFSNIERMICAVCNCNKTTDETTLREIIKKTNDQLLTYERIGEFCFASEPFSVQNGMLTSTFKKKRETLLNFYKNNQFLKV